jgi:TrmH family RNA methyltransferase
MANISNQERKYIKSLSVKKYRDAAGIFIVEGAKSVNEFLASSFRIRRIYSTSRDDSSRCPTTHITAAEMQQISNLKTPSSVLALVEIPKYATPTVPFEGLILALDEVQDPGNLGTIIRIADWFGIDYIVCSPFTADAYSPKTVQATMGSLARIKIVYTDLRPFLRQSDVAIYGTFLKGENIYTSALSADGIVVMGNEGNGISANVAELITRKLRIPSFADEAPESLNVAVAVAITCSEFKRRTYK